LTGRRLDIEDRRIAEMFDDRNGAREGGMRIVRIDDGEMLRPNAELSRSCAGVCAYPDLGRAPARQHHARRSAVHRDNVDAEKIHARRADEGGDELVRRRVVKLERRADLRDDPLVENNDLVSESHCFRLVMSHIDHRRAELGMEFRQFKAHLHTQFRVKVGKRLVEQENLGLAHERPADRHSLPLAARQLGRTTIEIGLEL
jgi:hypothetical protein